MLVLFVFFAKISLTLHLKQPFMNDISTSGPIQEQFILPSEINTTFEPLESRGFNQLAKVQRQGRWFLLKGLKLEFRQQPVYLELLKKE